MPASDDWIRVTQPETGHHITVHRTAFEATPEFVVLKRQDDAVNANGEPTPPKYRVEKGSTGTTTAAAKKES